MVMSEETKGLQYFILELIGAFLASIFVGYIGENYGWHLGFSLAGFGMILGQWVFLNGKKKKKVLRKFSQKEN